MIEKIPQQNQSPEMRQLEVRMRRIRAAINTLDDDTAEKAGDQIADFADKVKAKYGEARIEYAAFHILAGSSTSGKPAFDDFPDAEYSVARFLDELEKNL